MNRPALLLGLVAALAAVGLRPAPAEGTHLDGGAAVGLGGFVASATGYAPPSPVWLACLGHVAGCPAPAAVYRSPTPSEAAGWVAGSVTP